ncbi:hypothetical protein DY000_02050692 [Brassica cretica]|uniref:Zinc finger GRF-type domain-containing protein n=1 Tax=Brassica cretica TaxID=69181 RepID=A0ABQ7F9B2_BRACR|nr:hypothetical protein DY000_02050692 [Brassica cretica]
MPIRGSQGVHGLGFRGPVSFSLRRFPCDADAGAFLHQIADGLSPPRAQMDPAEERREMKRQKEYYNMVGYVCDSEYGIPTRCPCGSTIIDEVRGKEDYDTLPGKRFFTCKNYEEEIERLTKRVEEAEQVIKLVVNLNKQIETLEVQILTVKVADLEKLCFE